LSLEANDDQVVNQNGGIAVDDELHAALSRAAGIIAGERQSVSPQIPRPLTQPVLFNLIRQQPSQPGDGLAGSGSLLTRPVRPDPSGPSAARSVQGARLGPQGPARPIRTHQKRSS
jgi:hypothetical protein